MDAPAPHLSIGPSDFRKLRQLDALYVDKTALISDVLSDPAETILLPRPRRFGKTTNLSTLRYFLERSDEDRAPLFEGLAIWRDAAARPHFRRYPVLFLTFKDLKKLSFEQCLAGMAELLADLYGEHQVLLDQGLLSPADAEVFTAVLHRRATQAQQEAALRQLSRHLHDHHGQRAVILIDEYDTPLHTAFARGYFDQASAFFRDLLSGGLKDNPYLFKGVLTGILRVARESIFSGLNNLAVYSLLSPRFATAFGFTDAEVTDLAGRAGFTGSLDDLRAWYNGYLFGGKVIYNPWSVLCFLASGTGVFSPYWVNTGSDDLLRELLLQAGTSPEGEMEQLLSGQPVRKRITESITLRDIYLLPDALWSFLLFTGYLNATDVRHEEGVVTAALTIPNRELRFVFQDQFASWLERGLGGQREVEALTQALLAGDVEGVEARLSRLLLESASFLDGAAGGKRRPPEALYHAFILGLLVHLQPRYLVRSNRESGHGRSDVMVLPRRAGEPGVVLELKVRRKGETLRAALASARRQILERDYAAELRAQGAAPVQQIAVAFDGKRVMVAKAE